MLKFCILVYYLEITATFCELNFEKLCPFWRNSFHLKSGCVKIWTFRMSDLKGKLCHRQKRGKNLFEFVLLFPVGHYPQTNMSLSPMTFSLYGHGQGSSPSLIPTQSKHGIGLSGHV